jgi:mono/diheme cytochrome c family protein
VSRASCRRALASLASLASLALVACGDNVAPPVPDCSGLAPPAVGLPDDGAREAHRRAALRQRLRLREALEPGYLRRVTAPLVDEAQLELGFYCPQELYEVGRLFFEHPFSYADGLAAGPGAEALSPFRRVQRERAGGPETTTCTSCHWRGGPGGAGGLPDDSFLLGDGDRASSADARNPPSLVGAGAAQALGEEMTAELAALRADALARARRDGHPIDVELVAKGVSFGTLGVAPDGTLDTDGVRGVDTDLIVRPFGWKGTAATIAEFVAEAAAVHLGVQTEGLAASVAATPSPAPLVLGDGPADDPDGDGITDELSRGQLTALAAHVALLELPIGGPHERPVDRTDPTGPVEPYLVDEWARGRQLLETFGCASCHVPRMVLARSTVTIRAPGAERGVTVDLARDAEAPRLGFDDAAGGYPVFAYSDFKRHDLGEENAARHLHQNIGRRLYLTRRLWGVGASPPYFHDGASATVDDAIARHGGEAAFARAAWQAASADDRTALRIFLTSLRRAPRLVVP